MRKPKCPECGSKDLDITAFGFDFGAGYYRARCRDCEYVFNLEEGAEE